MVGRSGSRRRHPTINLGMSKASPIMVNRIAEAQGAMATSAKMSGASTVVIIIASAEFTTITASVTGTRLRPPGPTA